MMIDRRAVGANVCFKCKKEGHMSWQCPEGQKKVEQFIRSMGPSWKRQFANAIAELPESELLDPFEVDLSAPQYPYDDDDQSFGQTEQ